MDHSFAHARARPAHPRLACCISFVAVYGLQNTIDMIDGALARSA